MTTEKLIQETSTKAPNLETSTTTLNTKSSNQKTSKGLASEIPNEETSKKDLIKKHLQIDLTKRHLHQKGII